MITRTLIFSGSKHNKSGLTLLIETTCCHFEDVPLDTLEIETDAVMTIYLEGADFPLHLVSQAFINGDGPTGILYLATSDIDLAYDEITTIYGKRCNAEPYCRPLKQNASCSKSLSRTASTPGNYVLASMRAYIKLEILKVATKTDYFALKSRLYMNASRTAFETLHDLQPFRLAA